MWWMWAVLQERMECIISTTQPNHISHWNQVNFQISCSPRNQDLNCIFGKVLSFVILVSICGFLLPKMPNCQTWPIDSFYLSWNLTKTGTFGCFFVNFTFGLNWNWKIWSENQIQFCHPELLDSLQIFFFLVHFCLIFSFSSSLFSFQSGFNLG